MGEIIQFPNKGSEEADGGDHLATVTDLTDFILRTDNEALKRRIGELTLEIMLLQSEQDRLRSLLGKEE